MVQVSADPSAVPPARFPARPATILWIDDEARSDDALFELLKLDYGFHINVANTGEAGLAMSRSVAYDSIVLDLRLGDMYGLTVLDRLVAGGERAPILVVTGHYLEAEVQREALRAGAVAFMYKVADDHHRWAGMLTGIIEAARGEPLVSVPPAGAQAGLTGKKAATVGDRRIAEVIRLLKNTGGASGSIEALAERVGMTGSGLRHLWHRVMGSSVASFRRTARLDAAAGRLTMTHDRISEIATQAGFADLRYFEKQFRRRFGMSPTEFRTRQEFPH